MCDYCQDCDLLFDSYDDLIEHEDLDHEVFYE